MFICRFIYNVNVDEFFQNFQLTFSLLNHPLKIFLNPRLYFKEMFGIPEDSMLYNSCKQLQSTGFVYIEDCSL